MNQDRVPRSKCLLWPGEEIPPEKLCPTFPLTPQWYYNPGKGVTLGDARMGRVVVTGGTGLVGRATVQTLLEAGAQVGVVTRTPMAPGLPAGVVAHGWDQLSAALEGAAAVINLAGAGIAERRWTPARKADILASRLRATRRIIEAMGLCAHPPRTLVNASAIGYYGPQGASPLDESAPPGHGFLAEVCQAWEAEATRATELGVRVAIIRIGVVLAREGGALSKMAGPVRYFQGCKLGSGTQGLSWIHRDDLVAMLLEATRNPAWHGPFNGTAPQPLSNEAFMRLLAQRLHRPFLPVPGFLTTAATQLLLGELAEALLLQGAFVLPTRAQALGFAFRYPTAPAALGNLL